MAAPRRTCVGCRRVAGPDQLRRVASSRSGEIVLGRSASGRGAWICAGSVSCLEKALNRGALARALRTSVSKETAERLRAGFDDPEQQMHRPTRSET